MAQALRCKPKIILFDRADRSLDREGYQHVYHLLARLKGKASVLMVSDDENLIRLCDRLYLLDEANLRPLRTQSIGRPRPRLTLLEPGEVL
jgi:ATP-binding cassette subfamily C protein LapB